MQAADIVGLEILAREDRLDAAIAAAARVSIEPDEGMRMRRADEDTVCHVGALDVGDVGAAARHEAEIFLTLGEEPMPMTSPIVDPLP